jgi:hypothetical protein
MRSPATLNASILFAVCLAVGALTGACAKSSSTAPSSTETRIIRLGGDLNFGDVPRTPLGQAFEDRNLLVSNDGNAALHVERITGPCQTTGISPLSPVSFDVAPGATTTVGFRFAPKTVIDCSGEMTVIGNQTAGDNRIAVTAHGYEPVCHQVPGGLVCD